MVTVVNSGLLFFNWDGGVNEQTVFTFNLRLAKESVENCLGLR